MFMERALQLARMAQGRTSPNPAVGAVIVKNGAVVGEGHTQPAGSWHAEVMALRQAGDRADGATMYVTLEPCCHFGRTPPCTKAIIEAGISELHAATVDPNPLVAGKGLSQLEAAGIRTFAGEGKMVATETIEGFAQFITTGRPFFTLKWAMSLDGKIATRDGDSKWITGEAARARAHDLRDTSDAIVVGVNTIVADDSQLTVRVETGRASRQHDPWRIVVDSGGRIPIAAAVLKPKLASGTIVATTERMNATRRDEIARLGAEVLVLPQKQGRVDLSALAQELAARGNVNVMIEGGGTVLAAFLTEGLADKIYAFIAPKIVGGAGAPGPIGGSGITAISEAMQLERIHVEQIGEDHLITGYIARGG